MHSHAMDDVLDPVLQQFYLSSSSHSSSVLKVPNDFAGPRGHTHGIGSRQCDRQGDLLATTLDVLR